MAEITGPRDRTFSPRRFFLGMAILLFSALLFAPTSRSVNSERSSTSYSTDANGARGLYEVLGKLGFRVERRLEPMRTRLDPNAVYVIASPPQPLTPTEVHRVLEAVRAGAGLLVQPGTSSLFADSLRLTSYPVIRRDSAHIGIDSAGNYLPRWTSVLRTPVSKSDSALRLVPPPGARVFQSIRPRSGFVEPVTLGFPFGKGRIVAYANADFVRNQVIRQPGPAAIQAVRVFEWLDEGKTRPIVFDEYHHGFGTHADLLRVTGRGLAGTPPGRVLLQLAAAGLILLLAIAIRPIRPRPLARIERRSALEHVDALARAYSTVRANELATRLLVRGLRRRHAAVHSKADEAAYLRTLREQKPELAKDIDQLSSWLNGTDEPQGSALSATVSRIERGLRT